MNTEKYKNSYEGYVWSGKKTTLFGLPLSFTTYILTETRLITEQGLINVKIDEIELYKISDKSCKCSLFQRLAGCGSITIYSRDNDTPVKKMTVKEPKKVLNILNNTIHEYFLKYGREREMYANNGYGSRN